VSEPTKSTARVLIVDDDDDMREILRIDLSERGYDVRAADCGPAGIELAASWRPDVVLLDLGMPGMDGYQVAQRLREEHARAMRIVAFTGFSVESYLEKAIQAGFDAYVLKGTATMLEKIEELIAGAAAGRSS